MNKKHIIAKNIQQNSTGSVIQDFILDKHLDEL